MDIQGVNYYPIVQYIAMYILMYVAMWLYSGIIVTGSYTIYCTMYIVLCMLCDQTLLGKICWAKLCGF